MNIFGFQYIHFISPNKSAITIYIQKKINRKKKTSRFFFFSYNNSDSLINNLDKVADSVSKMNKQTNFAETLW